MGASFDPKLLTYPCEFTFTGNLPKEMSATLFTFSFPCKGAIYHDESALVALTLCAIFRTFFRTVDRVLQ